MEEHYITKPCWTRRKHCFSLKARKIQKDKAKACFSRNLSVHEPAGNGMFTVLFCTVGMLFEMRGSWVLYLSQGEKLSGKRSEIDVQRRKNWDMCSYRFCTNREIKKKMFKIFWAWSANQKKNKRISHYSRNVLKVLIQDTKPKLI